MPKDEKIKWSKFRIPCEGPYKVGKAYTNNIVQLESLHKDDLGTVNVNKLFLIIFPKPIIVLLSTMVYVILDYRQTWAYFIN
jgi:hypothetical protein